MTNKLIDLDRLSKYHEKLQGVLNTKEDAGAAAAAQTAAQNYADDLVKNEDGSVKFDEAGAAAEAFDAAKDYADGLAGNYDASGAAATAEQNAKNYADDLVKNEDGTVKFDDKGAAAQALIDAKAAAEADATTKANAAKDAAEKTATDLNAAMEVRVKALEDFDHDALAAAAAASAVSTILDGASDSFDTLKEVAEWIANNEHADDVATLVTDVENLKAIDHDAYKGADDTVLAGAKEYADGAAATALADAKADAKNLYQEKGDYLTASDFEFAEDSDIDGLFD